MPKHITEQGTGEAKNKTRMKQESQAARNRLGSLRNVTMIGVLHRRHK